MFKLQREWGYRILKRYEAVFILARCYFHCFTKQSSLNEAHINRDHSNWLSWKYNPNVWVGNGRLWQSHSVTLKTS